MKFCLDSKDFPSLEPVHSTSPGGGSASPLPPRPLPSFHFCPLLSQTPFLPPEIWSRMLFSLIHFSSTLELGPVSHNCACRRGASPGPRLRVQLVSSARFAAHPKSAHPCGAPRPSCPRFSVSLSEPGAHGTGARQKLGMSLYLSGMKL